MGTSLPQSQQNPDFPRTLTEVWQELMREGLLEREVLLSAEQLTDWDRLLRAIESDGISQDRFAQVAAITRDLSQSLDIPREELSGPDDPVRHASLGETIQSQARMPHAGQSRLLAYSRSDLEAASECEFQHVLETAANHKRIIRIAETGTRKVTSETLVAPAPASSLK